MILTQEQKQAIAPNLKLELEVINDFLEKYEINTPQRLACFFSQCAHESGGFSVKVENLNYSEKSLLAVFGKYFKTRKPAEYARNPKKIANLVYANRMGNGDESSGDGFKYRGRGFIQLTGRANYEAFAKHINDSLENVIIYLETTKGALESALFFWERAQLNEIADSGDFIKLTKRINGGVNGLEHREKLYNEFLAVLS